MQTFVDRHKKVRPEDVMVRFHCVLVLVSCWLVTSLVASLAAANGDDVVRPSDRDILDIKIVERARREQELEESALEQSKRNGAAKKFNRLIFSDPAVDVDFEIAGKFNGAVPGGL